MKDNKFVLLNTFKESKRGLFSNGTSRRSRMTNLMENALDYKIVMLANDLDVSKDYFKNYEYIDEVDSTYYAMHIDYGYSELGNGLREIIPQYYTIAIIDLETGSINKYPLDELLKPNMKVQDIKHLGNGEFILLTELRKRKKTKHYLYKIIID